VRAWVRGGWESASNFSIQERADSAVSDFGKVSGTPCGVGAGGAMIAGEGEAGDKRQEHRGPEPANGEGSQSRGRGGGCRRRP
jgi:hypothetical protein